MVLNDSMKTPGFIAVFDRFLIVFLGGVGLVVGSIDQRPPVSIGKI